MQGTLRDKATKPRLVILWRQRKSKAMDPDKLFLLEEYKALRAEILYLVRQSYLFEAAILVGVGAIYSWLFSREANNVNPIVWWLPFGITVLGAIRELGVRLRLFQLAEYIRKIEPNFLSGETGGWEHCLFSVRKKMRNTLLGISNILIWTSFVVITFLVALGVGR